MTQEDEMSVRKLLTKKAFPVLATFTFLPSPLEESYIPRFPPSAGFVLRHSDGPSDSKCLHYNLQSLQNVGIFYLI